MMDDSYNHKRKHNTKWSENGDSEKSIERNNNWGKISIILLKMRVYLRDNDDDDKKYLEN